MESITIREIIEQVESGQIRIPAFQRGFVWEPERVAQFIDSIYKGYPFGSLLLWRTSEKLKIERQLGPFILPGPKEDYPIDYVLDGQQRVTSAYATFQTTHALEKSDDSDWKEIFFDFSLPNDVQDLQFFALGPDEVDKSKHFPMRVVFDTTAYRKATKAFDEKLALRIDEMQARFKEARLPAQIHRTDEKSTVAVIFERINRQGVPLDTLQLLSAWTWSEDFQLQTEFSDLIDEVSSKGFDARSFDENLLLRCAAAVLVGNPRPDAIVAIPGEQVRKRFDEVLNGILGALDFCEMNFGIRRIDNLPFQTLLVPLSVFFAVSGTKQIVINGEQRETILKWFWRVSFARRYSSGVIRHLEDDIKGMLQLKGGQKSNLGNIPGGITDDFFIQNSFGIGNVNTKTFILMLAHQKPLSFVSGMPVDVNSKLKDYNNAEFHHMMPRAFLKAAGDAPGWMNSLANHCFLSRAENKELGGVAPSEYRKKMPKNVDQILERAICPASLFADQFSKFVKERARMLTDAANALIAIED
jgi:hypothetical protein